MVIAVIVISVILALALITQFTVLGIKKRRERLAQGLERQSFKEWWQTHKPSKRRLIQVYAAILFNAQVKGYITGDISMSSTKYMCSPGLNCYSCPGAVGACPLGALQNALRESNHRAPFYMLGILALFGLVLARTICGFLCPTGFIQELLYKIRTPKLKKSKVTRVLSYFKYVLLIVLVIAVPLIYGFMDKTLPAFCKYICPSGTFGGAIGLLAHPSHASDLESIGPAFTWKFCVLVVLAVASVFIYRFFCRFICPLGAIYGFFNRIALMGVKLDSGKCTDCGLCVQHCKMDIRKVGDHECINCGECISICPTKAISWKGSQIFIRGTSAATATQEVEVKPLTQFIKQPADCHSECTTDCNSERSEESPCSTGTPVGSFDTPPSAAAQDDNMSCHSERSEEFPSLTEPARKKKDRNFWLQVAAWSVALAVLVTALVCYNVDFKKPDVPPEPPDVTVGNAIGDICPDFTLNYCLGEEQYNLYANRGKITFINFWYIGCGGCEEEMPYICELSQTPEYADVEIIEIHGMAARNVGNYITEKGWSEYNINFVQDIITGNECQTFKALGGRALWPLTVILDEEGIVRYNSTHTFESFEDLKTVIDGIKN